MNFENVHTTEFAFNYENVGKDLACLRRGAFIFKLCKERMSLELRHILRAVGLHSTDITGGAGMSPSNSSRWLRLLLSGEELNAVFFSFSVSLRYYHIGL